MEAQELIKLIEQSLNPNQSVSSSPIQNINFAAPTYSPTVSLAGDMIDTVFTLPAMPVGGASGSSVGFAAPGSVPGYDPGVNGMILPMPGPETKEIGTSYVGSLNGMEDATRIYIREVIEPSGKISASANIQPIYAPDYLTQARVSSIETVLPDGTVRTREVPAPATSVFPSDSSLEKIYYLPTEVKLDPGEVITKATTVTPSGATSVVNMKPEAFQSYQFVSWGLNHANSFIGEGEKPVYYFVTDTFNASGSREKVGRTLTVIEPVIDDGINRTIETVAADGTTKTYTINFPAEAAPGYAYPAGRRATLELAPGEWPKRITESTGSGNTLKTATHDLVLGYDYLGTLSKASELRPKTLGNGEWGEMRIQMREEYEPGGRVNIRSISVFGPPSPDGVSWPARALETIDSQGVIRRHDIKPNTFEKYISARVDGQYVFMNIGADEQPLRVVDSTGIGTTPKVFDLDVVPINETAVAPGFGVVGPTDGTSPFQATHAKLISALGETVPGVYTVRAKYDSNQKLEEIAELAKSKGAEVAMLPGAGSVYGFQVKVKDPQTLYSVLDLPNVVSAQPESLIMLREMATTGVAVPPPITALPGVIQDSTAVPVINYLSGTNVLTPLTHLSGLVQKTTLPLGIFSNAQMTASPLNQPVLKKLSTAASSLLQRLAKAIGLPVQSGTTNLLGAQPAFQQPKHDMLKGRVTHHKKHHGRKGNAKHFIGKKSGLYGNAKKDVLIAKLGNKQARLAQRADRSINNLVKELKYYDKLSFNNMSTGVKDPATAAQAKPTLRTLIFSKK